MRKILSRPIYILIGLCALLVIAISAISLVSAVSLINKPFPGFVMYPFPYVGTMSLEDWAGRQAGLKFLDRIISVDGKPVWRGQDVSEAIKGKPPGTPVNYVVQSEGKTREVTLPVSLMGVGDVFMTFSLLVSYAV